MSDNFIQVVKEKIGFSKKQNPTCGNCMNCINGSNFIDTQGKDKDKNYCTVIGIIEFEILLDHTCDHHNPKIN